MIERVHRVFVQFDIALASVPGIPASERLLPVYIETINRCLALKTRMRLQFDRRDVVFIPLLDANGRFISQPQTLHVYPDDHSYRICFYASESQPGRHATLTADTNGDAVLCLVNFGALIDPALDWVAFWQHIATILHELGHTRGIAGQGGESYNGTTIEDSSGDEPLANVHIYRQPDAYWETRMARYKSPMCAMLTPGHPLFPDATSLDWCIANNQFTDHEAAILNGWYRGRSPAPRCLDMNAIAVNVNVPARIRVWSAPRNWSSGEWELIHEANAATGMVFAWHEQGWNRINACVKVVAAGYVSQAVWVSLFDLEEAGMRGDPEPFTINITMVPPPRPPWENDPRWPGSGWMLQMIIRFQWWMRNRPKPASETVADPERFAVKCDFCKGK